MKEYIISIKSGTSTFWYNYSIYAYSDADAIKEFMAYLCPYNMKDIKIKEV